jgi:hypothetical protein
MWQRLKESSLISYLSLFTSLGTLFCCALPSTLVLLGLGASLAGFLSKYPQFIWLSENKGIVFGLSFFMLLTSYQGQKKSSLQECAVEKKDDCAKTKKWSSLIFKISIFINLVGAFYAFALPYLMSF